MKSIISIILSALVLLSSTGVTYAQHFCGDYEMMAKLTLGQEVLSCGMAMPDVENCGDENSKDHHCCDNQYTQIDFDDTLTEASFHIGITQTFVGAFVSVFVLNTDMVTYHAVEDNFTTYRPPPLVDNLQVYYETFLI